MKKALTIGELLITMAIIGVIATLVLPGFMKDYHKKLYVTKFKKVIETIENYSTMYIIEEFSNGNNLEVFIKKKLPFLDNQLRNKLLLSIITHKLSSLYCDAVIAASQI